MLGKLARRNVLAQEHRPQRTPTSRRSATRARKLKLKMGLETDIAKTVVAAIKETKLKVTTQIQDKQCARDRQRPRRFAGGHRRAAREGISRLAQLHEFPRVKHWIVKSEPETYSFEQFRKDKTTAWDRHPQFSRRAISCARWRRAMRSSSTIAAIARTSSAPARVVKPAYPDSTVEPGEKGDWSCVDLKAGAALPKPVTLAALKTHAKLKQILLVRPLAHLRFAHRGARSRHFAQAGWTLTLPLVIDRAFPYKTMTMSALFRSLSLFIAALILAPVLHAQDPRPGARNQFQPHLAGGKPRGPRLPIRVIEDECGRCGTARSPT